MFRRRQRNGSGPDEGFTLIELLVVIIIIGILAAIAIPVFLNQRQKGYDSQAKSDLRNLANFEEVYLTDFQRYGTGAQVVAAEPKVTPSVGDTLEVVSFTSNIGYCLSATSPSGHTWFYDSNAGGLQPMAAAACPTAYATNDGVPIP
ncbi:MAG: prepilin-type N-terminal cleavage/methylation domain-containing protein [Frankiales bacterium]|nr:prepilin-type N-terminal cleavage/methylation domain-containing protein [Frankiales bacterium]